MKFREVITLENAAKDLDSGKAFYDSHEVGVGLYFIDSLLSDIESLQFYAGVHQIYYGFYRMLSKRFPYAIYYDIKGERVRIAAVLDMRRNPTWIHEQLKVRKRSAQGKF
jgi:plasmid stabilization system protein ParE